MHCFLDTFDFISKVVQVLYLLFINAREENGLWSDI